MTANNKRINPSMGVLGVTLLALIAFAANSVLCRRALGGNEIDPASFTAIRLISGALFLYLLVRRQGLPKKSIGRRSMFSWQQLYTRWSAPFYLFLYAAAFSFAYLQLTTGVGALVLFACVQLTMISAVMVMGKRLNRFECLGLVCAFAGLVYLLSPMLDSPSLSGVILMALAGIAWGFYTLSGRQSTNALRDTAYNFVHTIPFVVGLLLVNMSAIHYSWLGVTDAVLSGVLASGAGYALWFYSVKWLSIATAASCQLSVPLIAAWGGVLFNGESITGRLVVAMILVLLGIAMVIHSKKCIAWSSQYK